VGGKNEKKEMKSGSSLFGKELRNCLRIQRKSVKVEPINISTSEYPIDSIKTS
jgi:hypothetical protein